MVVSSKALSKIMLIILMNVFAWDALSQGEIKFKHFNGNNGLGWSSYFRLEQDTLGYIWAQAGEGLSRFDGYNWKNYLLDTTSKEKLSNFFIRELFKDNKGQLWTIQPNRETGDVLLRYDYLSDTFIPVKPLLNGKGFPNMKVMVDNTRPVFWISTKEGIYSFDLTTNITTTFLEFPKDPKMAEALRILGDIEIVKEGFLIATYRGLWLADKETKKLRRPPCLVKDSTLLYQADVRSILSYTSDEMWLGLGAQGVARLNANYEVTLKRVSREMMWKYSFTKDGKGRCYFGSNHNGLHVYDPEFDSWTYLDHKADKPETLKSNQVTDILIDREQNIWVSLVNYGISLSTKNEITFYNIPASKFYDKPLGMLSVYGNSFTLLSKGSDDYLLHAMKSLDEQNVLEINIAQINYANPGELNFKKAKIKVPFNENVSVVYPGKKYLWVNFFRGGTIGIPFNYELQQIENKPLRKIELVHAMDNANEYPLQIAVMSCWEDPDENLWLGNEFGVYRIKLSPSNVDKFDVELFSNDPADSLSLGGNPVSQFYSKDTTLWVITYTNGIDEMTGYKASKPAFNHVFPHQSGASVLVSLKNKIYIGSTRGLFESQQRENVKLNRNLHVGNHGVASILEDNNGRLWLLNELSVLFYDPVSHTTSLYTDDHGYLYKDWYNIKTSKGWFISFDNEGLTILNPEELKISDQKIKPVFTELEVNNKVPQIAEDTLEDSDEFIVSASISQLRELTLDYQHNDFAIAFSAMQMKDPQKIRYRYKLEGYDEEWVEQDWKSRRVHYTNLNAGKYTLRVKATNHHGIWSDEEASLLVTILPPPWKAWWAYTGYGLLFISLLYAGRRNIIQREGLKSGLKLQSLELEKAREMDRIKTAFFTNISHEFRTPLTLIKGPAQILLEQATDKLDKDQLKTIQQNADLLLKLINQLLELARLESGAITVKQTERNLNAFINAIAGSFVSLTEQRKINFSISLPPHAHKARLDYDKLETILINLIGNAIKFTPAEGKISAQVQLVDHSKLVISIADTGIGIPDSVQHKIFERFYQVNENHQETGTGIGLALVKELTEFLGGSIELKSQVGKGSTFTVTLPVILLQEEVQQEEDSRVMNLVENSTEEGLQEMLDSEKPYVLVVEDNTDLRKFIITSLLEEYNFIEAANGKEALAIALKEIPDLIISDVMMPEMDGFTLTEKIRNDIRTSHIPVILLTAKATEEAKLSGLSMGADDYLTKPFDKNELVLKVRNSISRQVRMREQARLSLLKEVPKLEVVSADEQFLQKVKQTIMQRLADEKLNVEIIAGEVGLSRSQLFRKVTALTGSSVNELIRSFRLQKAAQLLVQKWGPVSQVAYEVGFSNLSYFSKCFKEQYGVLPSEYPK